MVAVLVVPPPPAIPSVKVSCTFVIVAPAGILLKSNSIRRLMFNPIRPGEKGFGATAIAIAGLVRKIEVS